jgi:hypothetical protein
MFIISEQRSTGVRQPLGAEAREEIKSMNCSARLKPCPFKNESVNFFAPDEALPLQ